jgi:hypothetical protein
MTGTAWALAAAAVAVVCCAGLPLLIAIVGGLTLAGVLGLAGLAVALGLLALALLTRLRRRPSASQPPEVRR